MLEMLEKKKKAERTFDSCAVQIPKEFALANGLPEKSFVSLTLRNGKLESEIIAYGNIKLRAFRLFLLCRRFFSRKRNRLRNQFCP